MEESRIAMHAMYGVSVMVFILIWIYTWAEEYMGRKKRKMEVKLSMLFGLSTTVYAVTLSSLLLFTLAVTVWIVLVPATLFRLRCYIKEREIRVSGPC